MSLLLDPKSIAVIGASPTRNRSKSLLQNLGKANYKGEVFAINPRYTDVLGYKCFPSLESLPSPVDCVVALVGADAAIDALEKAFAIGTRAAVVPWPVLARAATGRNELRDYAAWPPVACMSAVRIVSVS